MAVKSLTREDIAIDWELLVEDDGISAYIETWFDTHEKFSVDAKGEGHTWINLYALYNPDTDILSCTYTVNTDDSSEEFPYTPTPEETALIKAMMEETCLKEYGCDLRGLWHDTE